MFNNQDLMEHHNRLEKFAYKLTRNKADAEDLLQSTLLRAIEKKQLFQEGTNLFSWTSKIMYNMFVSGYRRKVKFESQYDPESHIQNMSVDESQTTKMEYQDVDRAMDDLSKEHREIIKLVCIQGKQYSEVAKEIGIPVGTVRSRLSRAREALQASLNSTKYPISAKFMQDSYKHNNVRAAA